MNGTIRAWQRAAVRSSKTPMPTTAHLSSSDRFTRRVSAVTILLFWLAQFSMLTVQRWVFGAADDARFHATRLVVTGVGIALSSAILAFHIATRGRPLSQRLLYAVLAAIAGSAVHAFANFWIFRATMPADVVGDASLTSHLLAMLQWFSTYAAMSGLLLAIVYSGEVRDYERGVARLQREAHEAHLRALRYQLNPHFMFNTLNSIASLIGAGRVQHAEHMVENLSDFLRAGLALDPHEDIPLAEEIELQSTYLAIEAVRFPNRLVVEIDVPDDVQDARVPSLIVQPLVENAVRHAVSMSTRPVKLTVTAAREGDRLRLSVRDSGGNAGNRRAPPGTGVGLTNVAERLMTRYGEDCGFTAGRLPEGGFQVTFAIPFTEVRR